MSRSSALLCRWAATPSSASRFAWRPDWKTRLGRGPESELERLVLARLLIAKGREDEAQLLLEQPQDGDRPPSIRYAIEAGKTAALAAADANDPTAPLLLEIALSMAEPEGLVQTFVDDAAALSSVSRPGDSGVSASVGPVQQALAGARATASTRPRNAVLPQLVEELTEREVSVLHYLPTRMTNLEIGRELFISSNTVKTHLEAIYRKLGVSNRDDAVAVAVNLRLV